MSEWVYAIEVNPIRICSREKLIDYNSKTLVVFCWFDSNHNQFNFSLDKIERVGKVIDVSCSLINPPMVELVDTILILGVFKLDKNGES